MHAFAATDLPTLADASGPAERSLTTNMLSSLLNSLDLLHAVLHKTEDTSSWARGRVNLKMEEGEEPIFQRGRTIINGRRDAVA